MMVALLLVLGGIMAYLFFDKGFWLDTWARSGEESMRSVRAEYKRKNNQTESWMTKHDREYEHQQEEEAKWRQ